MNISRTNSVPVNLPQVASRASASKVARDPDQDGDQHSAPTAAGSAGNSQRLANLATKIENRVQNAIDDGNLSDEQKKALEDAASAFQKLMNRIGNADFEKSPKRQVMFALHQLADQMKSILGPVDGGDPLKTAATTTNNPSTKNVPTIRPVQIDKLA